MTDTYSKPGLRMVTRKFFARIGECFNAQAEHYPYGFTLDAHDDNYMELRVVFVSGEGGPDLQMIFQKDLDEYNTPLYFRWSDHRRFLEDTLTCTTESRLNVYLTEFLNSILEFTGNIDPLVEVTYWGFSGNSEDFSLTLDKVGYCIELGLDDRA